MTLVDKNHHQQGCYNNEILLTKLHINSLEMPHLPIKQAITLNRNVYPKNAQMKLMIPEPHDRNQKETMA